MPLLMALLGSGEFEPWTEQVDRWLLDRAAGEGSVLILPTASAPEGEDVFDRWASLGLSHYEALGIAAEALPLKTKADAGQDDLAGRLDSASIAYFSGGNPAYLADVLRGSPFWDALRRAMDRGLAYVGCSAGMACLGDVVPDSTVVDFMSPDLWRPGLGLFPQLLLAPHWDALEAYVPGLQELFARAVPNGHRLLAIDERTAMVGDGTEWQVMGKGTVSLMESGSWQTYRAGQSFETRLSGTG
jgi:cyanophycinase